MPASAPVRFEGRAVVIEGGPLAGRRPLFAGSLSYLRLEQRRWARALAALRGLGFTFVDTAVPWSAHERGPGRFDFGGARDLGAFLDACAGEGLPVLLRIGPRVPGEHTAAGLPERVLADGAMLQRTNDGSPAWVLEPPRGYPMPSLASPKFLTEVAQLYRAIGEVVGPRLAPDGPVALLALDHEPGGFLRAGPFCGDYHPAALARFADEHAGAAPPRRLPRPCPAHPEALRPLLDWMRFREREVVRGLAALSELAEEAGMARSVPGAERGALRLCAFAPLAAGLFDVAAAERAVDAATLGFLDAAEAHGRTAERARYLAGSSRFPLAAPLAFGSFPWGPSRTGDDGLGQLLGALAGGVFGHALGAAVARDRWIGAPIDESGRLADPAAEALSRVQRGLAAAGWCELVGATERPAVGLLVPRDYLRLDLSTGHLGPLGPLAGWIHLAEGASRADTFGFEGPIQRERHAALGALRAELQQDGLPYVELDDSAPDEALARLPALVLLGYDFLDERLAARLRAWAAGADASGRARRLLVGPRVATCNAAMQQAGPGALDLPGERFGADVLADPAALGAAIARLAGSEPGSALPGAGVAALHRPGEADPAVLFIAPAGASIERGVARAATAGATEYMDLVSGERFVGPTLEVPRGDAVRVLVPAPIAEAARGGAA